MSARSSHPLIVNLGNEPHGTGDVVTRNVEAYRVLYETVKAVDPSIPVVATSVEPNEEYFRAGYGKFCDAYDFHIYEDAENVRRTMNEYRALARKYGVEKPIWSTELGLSAPENVSLTRETRVAVNVSSGMAESIDVVTPPFWKVERAGADESAIHFVLHPPKRTAVRDFELTVSRKDGEGRLRSELLHRIPAVD